MKSVEKNVTLVVKRYFSRGNCYISVQNDTSITKSITELKETLIIGKSKITVEKKHYVTGHNYASVEKIFKFVEKNDVSQEERYI